MDGHPAEIEPGAGSDWYGDMLKKGPCPARLDDLSLRTIRILELVDSAHWPVWGRWLRDGSLLVGPRFGLDLGNHIGTGYIPLDMHEALYKMVNAESSSILFAASEKIPLRAAVPETEVATPDVEGRKKANEILQRISLEIVTEEVGTEPTVDWFKAEIEAVRDFLGSPEFDDQLQSPLRIVRYIDVVQSARIVLNHDGKLCRKKLVELAHACEECLVSLFERLGGCPEDASYSEKRSYDAIQQLRYVTNRFIEDAQRA